MSDFTPFRTQCPVVKAEEMGLWQWVTVGGTPTLAPFRRRIIWLRESETVLVLRHGDAEIRELCTSNDWYGFLSSLEGSLADVIGAARRYGITPQTVLRVAVDTSITDRPIVEDPSSDARENNAKPEHKKMFLHVPACRWLTSDKRTKPSDEWSAYPQLETAFVAQRCEMWNSQQGFADLPGLVVGWIRDQRAAAAKLERAAGVTDFLVNRLADQTGSSK